MTPVIKVGPGSKDPVPAAPQAEFLPKDDFNVKLVSNVGPTDYVNPEPLDKYDMVRRWTKESGFCQQVGNRPVVLGTR